VSFDQSLPLQTDDDTALARAKMLLGVRGFAVDTGGGQLLAQGPPLQSPFEDPVLGAGKVKVVVGEGAARLSADLSGLHRLRWFVLFAPPLLAVLLGVGMTASGVDGALRPALFNAILCMLLGPVAVVLLRRRSERALSALLEKIICP
jgi:hypothetical protein